MTNVDPPFDPDNITADNLYVQIRAKSAELKAINTQITQVQGQLTALQAAAQTKLGELIALRNQIQVELTGVPVQS